MCYVYLFSKLGYSVTRNYKYEFFEKPNSMLYVMECYATHSRLWRESKNLLFL